ncbi:MAG: SHOCT domain-containing protein [Gemmatimonadetes bacterium]|nr:SHOCT domain-containing protein [Gemmatimonadota bacterium]MCH8143871.1 SHOCT domain-containing protein [Gemmatimonadota bacterium]MCH8256222.1 SHOCT domain-containing protein [Gemmatimonadota bacterium]MCH8936582.1 SHOCT domain-containing protein [Gemmatimonadota bacterium]
MGYWTHDFGMLYWWAGIAAASLVIFWFFARFTPVPAQDESAEELLRRSFAAGEIDETEFYERLSVLRGSE